MRQAGLETRAKDKAATKVPKRAGRRQDSKLIIVGPFLGPPPMFSNIAWDLTFSNITRPTTSDKDGLVPPPVARWRGRDAQYSFVAQRVRHVSSGCYGHGSATTASKASTTTARTWVENRHVRLRLAPFATSRNAIHRAGL